jgi:acyl-CoA synthetase (AMP-forming)/AMP-acid ligase II/NAD(P)-dependent dehydrogenase (short-subunit alcohol dehydrogenase family)/acyl carrier protein
MVVVAGGVAGGDGAWGGCEVVGLAEEAERLGAESGADPGWGYEEGRLAWVRAVGGVGVGMEQGALARGLAWVNWRVGVGEGDGVLHGSGVGVWGGVWEVFGALWGGGRVVIGGGDEWVREWGEVRAGRVTLLHLDPATAVAHLESLEAELGAAGANALRCIIIGGGPLRRAAAEEWTAKFSCELHYAYAPPEAGGAVRWSEYGESAARSEYVAAEQALPGAVVYVLDERLQPVPVGVRGEIYVGGEDVARGYIGDAARTAERCVPDPFAGHGGARMWRTGDEGSWTEEGRLEVSGCVGRGAWVGGERVELNEVEEVLLGEESVEECRVVWREAEDGRGALVCYVAGAKGRAVERLRERARAVLPGRLRPGAYVETWRLPVTPGGEVDEARLGALEVIEEGLVRRWEEAVRGVEGVAEVAVVAQEKEEKERRLHLSDLLPGWESDLASTFKESVTATVGHAQDREVSEPLVMAFSDGGPLMIDDDAPKTLTEALIRTAAEHTDKGITYVQSDGRVVFQSYASLLEEAKIILAGLSQEGLEPRDKVILQLDDLRDHFSTFWACVLGGITPVTVALAPSYDEENSVVNKLYNTWVLLGHPPVVASEHLVESLSGLRRGMRVLSVRELQKHPPSEQVYQSRPEDVVFFQLTSGSTGVPKCIQETHRGIISHIHASRQFNRYEPDNVSLNWLPMDHVVPILTYHLKDTYSGYQQIQARTEVILADPLKWLDLIEAYRVTHTWSPNFGFKLVSDRLSKVGDRVWDLSSVQFFMNAGEQVTLPVVSEFLRLTAPFQVPTRAMQPAFGMAEVCTCMTYQNSFDPETGVHRIDKASLGGRLRKVDRDGAPSIDFIDLGPPVPGVQIRIADGNNRLLPEGTIGRLQIKGDVVTPGYFNNDAANQEAFVGDGWFNSGDLGFILDGRLTLTGREKEIIIVHGANYYCYEIEDVVTGVDGVEPTYVGACAVANPNTGTEGLAIFFSPTKNSIEANVNVVNAVREKVALNVGISPSYVVPVPREEFPKTTSGKIQRGKLRESLLAGHFEPILKELDIHLENANTLPDWFYRTTWRRKEAANLTVLPSPGHYLVFLDGLGLGEFLCEQLGRLGHPCIAVEQGTEFAQLGADRYRIDPKTPGHYRRLFTSLLEDRGPVDHVLHLWTYEQYGGEAISTEALRQAQEQGLYSLLFLIQALVREQGPGRGVRMDVISSFAQMTSPDDTVASEKATMTGLLRTIPLELPWLRCRHVDVEPDQAGVIAEQLIRELRVIGGEAEVAYRKGRRFVKSLQKVNMLEQEVRDVPLRRGGVYLLTGGLGGVGAHLAQYLTKHYGARLIIVGRTRLPERGEWASHMEQDTPVARRLRNYLAVEAAGGEFRYEALDVSDLAGLREAVEAAEATWQRPLAGVIHLAGEESLQRHWEEMDRHWVAEESVQTFEAMFRAKLYGTWTLYQLMEERPRAVFISFSSVNGWFGGTTFSAYSAANSFIDSYSMYQRHQRHRPSYCISWTMWDDLGMSEGNPTYAREAARSLGYHVITKEQGVASLLAGLSRDEGHLFVGLDGRNRQMRRYSERASRQAEQLFAYFTAAEQLSDAKFQKLEVRDRFQRRSSCAFVQLDELPLTDDGQVDREQLVLSGRARRGVADQEAPRNELEQRIASIWQDVLRIPPPSVHDSFFSLGGHSLSATQILSRLSETFQVELPLRYLFEKPTIAGLAEVVENMLVEELEQLTEDEAQSRLEEV